MVEYGDRGKDLQCFGHQRSSAKVHGGVQRDTSVRPPLRRHPQRQLGQNDIERGLGAAHRLALGVARQI